MQRGCVSRHLRGPYSQDSSVLVVYRYIGGGGGPVFGKIPSWGGVNREKLNVAGVVVGACFTIALI